MVVGTSGHKRMWTTFWEKLNNDFDLTQRLENNNEENIFHADCFRFASSHLDAQSWVLIFQEEKLLLI